MKNKPKRTKQQISFYLTASAIAALKKLAEREMRPVSHMLEVLILAEKARKSGD